MNKKIFRQYDSRWGSLPYPTKGSSFAGNGCGACSVLHCIIERKKYAKYTPKKIIGYMKQFAVSGQGTTWSGIYKALKHYGMASVKWFGASDPIKDIFAELNKGGRIGVILFGSSRGPDGTVWTTGGHYIAFTGYKVKDGKHYFYLKDSGPRCHDGWHCYEKSMAGDVRQVWTCTVPKAKPKEKTLKAWKKTCQEWNKYYQSHGYYYNPNPRKKGGKSLNCCGFALRCLFHFGEIQKAAIYAYTKKGKLKGQGADLIRKACIVKENLNVPFHEAVEKGLVKPGDIIGYADNAHTEIYKGKCKREGDKDITHKFYNYNPKFRQTNGVAYRPLNYDRKVGCIIRIKGLKR